MLLHQLIKPLLNKDQPFRVQSPKFLDRRQLIEQQLRLLLVVKHGEWVCLKQLRRPFFYV